MTSALHVIWHGLRDALLMGWEVWWALVLGFLISAIAQAWIPRERIVQALSGGGARPIATATALGAASSSCSYAAVAIGKSVFSRGASAASMLAFQFASTNLVWELGLVLWVLLGWQFTLGEYVGGVVMIVLMALFVRRFVSPRLEAQAREHAEHVEAAHHHHTAGNDMSWRRRFTSEPAWTDVAHNFVHDWRMLYREITAGLLLAGFAAQIPQSFFRSLFLIHASSLIQALWGALIGPVIAIVSFVCSVGNVPLAAVLWSGGISFAGVMGFIFADLIILPLVMIYRKFYGTRFALRITALMLVTMVLAALTIEGVFSALSLIPSGPRPSHDDIFGSVTVDYRLVLNLAGLAVFTALFGLTVRARAASLSVHRS